MSGLRRNPVSRFLAWWGGELSAIAAGLSRWRTGPMLVARPQTNGLSLELRRGRARSDLGALAGLPRARLRRLAADARRGRLEIVLAATGYAAVRSRVVLPLAAEEDLDGVLGYEIDRLTPFRADEVFFDQRLAARSPSADRIEVDLAFTPRARHAPALEALAKAGLPANRLDLIGEDAVLEGLDLLPRRARQLWTPGRAATAALCGAAVVLATIWGALTLERAEAETAALRAAADAARAAALAAQGGREAAAREGPAVAAYRLKSASSLALDAVALVSEILPDDAWLDRLNIRDGTLELSGRAANPAELIARFEAHERFRDPVFRAPITQVGDDGGSRFLLAVTMTPEETLQ